MNALHMNQKELVGQLLSMTREIEKAASRANWLEVAGLVEARSPLLMSLLENQESDALEMIQQIRVIDSKIFTGARTALSELHAECLEAVEVLRVSS